MVRTLTRWTVKDYHHMIESGLLAGRQVELDILGSQLWVHRIFAKIPGDLKSRLYKLSPPART